MKCGRTLLAGGFALGAWASTSCSPSSFQSETVIDTVRILASRASEPKAKPGDSVTVDVLAYDGRSVQPEKMNIFWLPPALLCKNPKLDAYYACFSQFGVAAGDAGAGPSGDGGAGAGLGLLRPGVDLTPLLVSGPTFTFDMPGDIIVPRDGVSPSYGLVILFNFACAGHIELLPYDPNDKNPQQIPIGCFDAQHKQLGPSDFVFGLTRVYAYATSDEINPVDHPGRCREGASSTSTAGTTTAPFTAPLCTQSDCPHHPIGPLVPPSAPLSKQVWADFYSTIGTFTSGARLLYNPSVKLSMPGATNNNFLSPNNLAGAPAQNFIWIVVHDDQGGADWVTVPLEVQ